MSQRGTDLPDRHEADSAPLSLRQGDVLLVEIEAIPTEARMRRRDGRIVLAEGEATGHAHAIHEEDAREFWHGEERFLLTRSRSQLVHEEHAPIVVPPGSWRIVQQREYVPPVGERMARGWRPVVD